MTPRKPFFLRLTLASLATLVLISLVSARNPNPDGQAATPPAAVPADLRALLTPAQSEMIIIARRYESDRELLSRFYDVVSPDRFARVKRFDVDWAAELDKLDAGRLSPAAQTDLENLKSAIRADIGRLETEAASEASLAPLLPFADGLRRLEQSRRQMESMDAEKAALVLSQALEQISQTRAALEAGLLDEPKPGALKVGPDTAVRGVAALEALDKILRRWFGFYNGYDPLFTWWMAQPFKEVDKAILDYAAFLRDRVAPASSKNADVSPARVTLESTPAPKVPEVPDLARLLRTPQDELRGIARLFLPARGARGSAGRSGAGDGGLTKPFLTDWLAALKKLDFDRLSRPARISYLALRNSMEGKLRRLDAPPAVETPVRTDASGISGRPLGRSGLMLDLADEMIPYTPEQLIEIGLREYAWCEAEMIKASRTMGFGENWRQAMEKVKDMHVPPGGQPDGIRDLLREAVEYIRAKDLLTIPEIENETMRMEMMSPERQLVNPFFTGGSLISVSYPTDTMTTRQKIESMRGNSLPFSHATAFHEMIPGHNMQDFMGRRYDVYRSSVGGSSFWSEGWCVYWEMIMYDLGFHDTPEKRIGALFWRMHRCARIVFSLKFHLGEWSPRECIDYLVDQVNFERENAVGEVRRSFAGGYGPLYQAAYQLGALQLRRISRELVDSGKMTYKQFHDAVIEMGSLPFPLVRLALSDQKLSRDMSLEWKFYGDISGR